MKQKEQLDEVMAELRREHRQIEAPLFLETRLRSAVREARPAPGRLSWRWSYVIVVLAILGWAIWDVHRSVLPSVFPRDLQARQEQPKPVTPGRKSHVPPVNKKLVSQNHAHARVHRHAVETASDFMALPESEVLPEPSEASVLSLWVPKSELRRYGFDVSPSVAAQSVRADFLVGEDGLARAVRFVQ